MRHARRLLALAVTVMASPPMASALSATAEEEQKAVVGSPRSAPGCPTRCPHFQLEIIG